MNTHNIINKFTSEESNELKEISKNLFQGDENKLFELDRISSFPIDGIKIIVGHLLQGTTRATIPVEEEEYIFRGRKWEGDFGKKEYPYKISDFSYNPSPTVSMGRANREGKGLFYGCYKTPGPVAGEIRIEINKPQPFILSA